MHSDKKCCHGLTLSLKHQSHRNNEKPMPREQTSCHTNEQGLHSRLIDGQLTCQICYARRTYNPRTRSIKVKSDHVTYYHCLKVSVQLEPNSASTSVLS